MSRRLALSPQPQLAFLVLRHDVLKKHKDAQIIISRHSPVLLGYPGAQILSFDGERIEEMAYDDTASAQIVRHFLNNRETVLEELLEETPSLFSQ